MPDDQHAIYPRCIPERIDLAALRRTSSASWQIAKLRRDLVHAAVWAGDGLSGAIIGIEMWSRYVAACSSL
jgi:hypothetical protein